MWFRLRKEVCQLRAVSEMLGSESTEEDLVIYAVKGCKQP